MTLCASREDRRWGGSELHTAEANSAAHTGDAVAFLHVWCGSDQTEGPTSTKGSRRSYGMAWHGERLAGIAWPCADGHGGASPGLEEESGCATESSGTGRHLGFREVREGVVVLLARTEKLKARRQHECGREGKITPMAREDRERKRARPAACDGG